MGLSKVRVLGTSNLIYINTVKILLISNYLILIYINTVKILLISNYLMYGILLSIAEKYSPNFINLNRELYIDLLIPKDCKCCK